MDSPPTPDVSCPRQGSEAAAGFMLADGGGGMRTSPSSLGPACKSHARAHSRFLQCVFSMLPVGDTEPVFTLMHLLSQFGIDFTRGLEVFIIFLFRG